MRGIKESFLKLSKLVYFFKLNNTISICGFLGKMLSECLKKILLEGVKTSLAILFLQSLYLPLAEPEIRYLKVQLKISSRGPEPEVALQLFKVPPPLLLARICWSISA